MYHEKKRRKEEKNKKYWLIPAISLGIASFILATYIFNITNDESLLVICTMSSIIGIISSFFTRQKQWTLAGLFMTLFWAIMIVKAIIGVTHFGCTWIGISGGLDSAEISEVRYDGFNQYKCKTQDVINTVLSVIQYIFLIIGTIGIPKAIYKSIKQDKN